MTPERRPEWFERSFAYVVVVYAAVLVSVLAATLLVAQLAAIPLGRAFAIVFGGFTVIGAYWKPWWYWEHIDGWLARWTLGDRVARFVLIALGLLLLGLGLFADLPGAD